MSVYDQKPIDLSLLATYPLASRPSKVTIADFARPLGPDASVRDLLASLPRILAAEDLRAVAGAVRDARARALPVIAGMGGHVVKTGLAPVLIDLMRRGIVTALAMNGSCLVHDFEIAVTAGTSEDVDATLGSGSFGAAEETGRILNEAATSGAADGIGLGEAVGRRMHIARGAPRGRLSPRGGLRIAHSRDRPRRDRQRHPAHSPDRRRGSDRRR